MHVSSTIYFFAAARVVRAEQLPADTLLVDLSVFAAAALVALTGLALSGRAVAAPRVPFVEPAGAVAEASSGLSLIHI